MNKLLATLLFVTITISGGFCLECYECDSSQSMLCNVGLLSFTMPVTDCSKSSQNDASFLTSWVPKQCVKITAKDSEGKEYVARGCVPHIGGACDVLFKTLGFFSGLAGGASDVNCHTCDGDKCNSSLQIKPSIAATLILSLLFLVFKP